MPSTYLSGQHGARAAYETLLRSGYSIERWERPLSELAATAGPDTVVIFAEPFTREPGRHQGRPHTSSNAAAASSPPASGAAFILPGEASATPDEFSFAACKLEPEGLDPARRLRRGLDGARGYAGRWAIPRHRVDYSCAGQPAVVEYDWGKGHVVWWASSTPLENGSLARANDLDLLLNSLGPARRPPLLLGRVAPRRYSLHLELCRRPVLDHALDRPARAGLLVVFSFSRRSGPVRELPSARPRHARSNFLKL